MIPDDSVSDAEPDPGAIAYVFCRKERGEDLWKMLFWNSTTVITNLDHNLSRSFVRTDCDAAVAPVRYVDRLHGIDQRV